MICDYLALDVPDPEESTNPPIRVIPIRENDLASVGKNAV
jgi:hypothetical protein